MPSMPVLSVPVTTNGRLVFNFVTDPYVTYVSGILTLYDETKTVTPNPVQVNLSGCQFTEGCIEVSGLQVGVTYACMLVAVTVNDVRHMSNTVKGLLLSVPDPLVLNEYITFNSNFTTGTVKVTTGTLTAGTLNLTVYNNGTDEFSYHSYSPSDFSETTENFSANTEYFLSFDVTKFNFYTIWGSVGTQTNESVVSNTVTFYASDIPPEPKITVYSALDKNTVGYTLDLRSYQVKANDLVEIYAKSSSDTNWTLVKTINENNLAINLNGTLTITNLVGYLFASRVVTTEYSSKHPSVFTIDELAQYGSRGVAADVAQNLSGTGSSGVRNSFIVNVTASKSDLDNLTVLVKLFATIGGIEKMIGVTSEGSIRPEDLLSGKVISGTYDNVGLYLNQQITVEITLTQSIPDNLSSYWLSDSFFHDPNNYNNIVSNASNTFNYLIEPSSPTNLTVDSTSIDLIDYFYLTWTLPADIALTTFENGTITLQHTNDGGVTWVDELIRTVPKNGNEIPTSFSFYSTTIRNTFSRFELTLDNIVGSSLPTYSDTFTIKSSDVQYFPITNLVFTNQQLGVLGYNFYSTAPSNATDLNHNIKVSADGSVLYQNNLTLSPTGDYLGTVSNLLEPNGGFVTVLIEKSFQVYGLLVNYSTSNIITMVGIPVIKNHSFSHDILNGKSTVSFDVESLSQLTGVMVFALPSDPVEVDLFKNLPLPPYSSSNVYNFTFELDYLTDTNLPGYLTYVANTIGSAYIYENL